MTLRVPHSVAACLLLAATLSAGEVPPSAPSIAPTLIAADAEVRTLAEALAAFRAAGFSVEAPALDGSVPCSIKGEAPFWQALEGVAKATGTQIVSRERGRRITLVKHGGVKDVSCIRGPFRVVARQVTGRLDLETGRSFQEVLLEVHWEPHVPVFRIDSVPAISRASDDLGHDLKAAASSVLSPATGASHAMSVRLSGVPRKAGAIAVLAGDFTVTASPRMLPFSFDGLGGPMPIEGRMPAGVPADLRDKVRATLKGWKLETLGGKKWWEAEIGLAYPAGMPAFQSFETWLTENRLRLVSPARAAVVADQAEEPGPGREMTAVYRFDAAKLSRSPTEKGWSLVYDTPAPLVEFRVPFELKGIPLP